jgi:hypothetical protein
MYEENVHEPIGSARKIEVEVDKMRQKLTAGISQFVDSAGRYPIIATSGSKIEDWLILISIDM